MAKVNAGKKGKPVVGGKKNIRPKTVLNAKRTQAAFKAKRPAVSTNQQANTSGQTLMRRTGKLLKVTQPINDLRQLIKTKGGPQNTANKKTANTNSQSAKKDSIKKRLGLQSASAKNRAKLAAQSATTSVESGTSDVTLSRRPAGNWGKRVWRAKMGAEQAQSILLPQSPMVPPMVMIAPPNVPTTTPLTIQPQTTGYSVIVSNLNPSVTQAEVTELFSEIGPVQSVQVINSSTSMVTYFNASHASQAIAEYNNRFLDGQPMQVTLIPAPTAGGNVVRRAFREAFAH